MSFVHLHVLIYICTIILEDYENKNALTIRILFDYDLSYRLMSSSSTSSAVPRAGALSMAIVP